MIISVDFDGCLCEHRFPDIGKENLSLILALKLMKDKGHKLILWTCRKDEYLRLAVEWCSKWGLSFDALNEDLPEIKETEFGKGKSCKVFADVYLDDRNVGLQDFIIMTFKSENKV